MASPSDWARLISTTIVQHLRETEEATFRKFKVFALLEQSGNVIMNQSGRGFDWNVRYRLPPVSSNNGAEPRTFARVNQWKRASLDWKGFSVQDSILRREMLENRGQQALVDVSGKMAERLQESLEHHLSYQPYADGGAATGETNFDGMDTFLGYNGTISEAIGAGLADQRTSSNLADRYGYPEDSYAGLNCKLGYYGGGRIGEGSNQWPNSPVDPEFDYWSPVIINYNSQSFNNGDPNNSGAAYGNWKANCVAAIREGLHQCKRNDTREAQIDLVVLARELYIDFLNAHSEKERIVVTKENGLKSLGFDVTQLDGVEIGSEYAVPAGKGYGISVGNMELRCLENQLMVAEGPFYQEELQSYRFSCSTLGNFKFKSPRNFFLLDAVTAES